MILINDLPKASTFFTILFADDKKTATFFKKLTLYDLENFELSKIEDWFKANDDKDKDRVGVGCKMNLFNL